MRFTESEPAFEERQTNQKMLLILVSISQFCSDKHWYWLVKKKSMKTRKTKSMNRNYIKIYIKKGRGKKWKEAMGQSGHRMKEKDKNERRVVGMMENRKDDGEGVLEMKRQCQYLSNYSCNPIPYRSDISHLPTPNSIPDFLFISAAPSSLLDLLLLFTATPLCRYELYLNTSGKKTQWKLCVSLCLIFFLSFPLISVWSPSNPGSCR